MPMLLLQTASRQLIGSLLLLLLLAACSNAPPETKLTRFTLDGRAALELQLPRGWTAEPSWGTGSQLVLIRFSARGNETVQLRISPRPQAATATATATAAAAALGGAELARRELADSKTCDGVSPAMLERPVGRGVAAYCTRSSPGGSTVPLLTPTTAGALVLPGLVARFTLHGVNEGEGAAAWSILQSLQVERYAFTSY